MGFKFLLSSLVNIRISTTSRHCLKSSSSSAISVAKMSSESYPTVSYVTAPNETVAQQLSRKLVECRLAACVNMIKSVESVYEWEGKIQQDNEILLIIKSQSSKSEDLVKFVRANHPYDCPEVISLKVDSGSKPYLDWIQETVGMKPICPQE